MMRDNLRLSPIKGQPAFSGGRRPGDAISGGVCSYYTQSESFVNTHVCATRDYMLTPGRYVGAAEVEDDDEPFEEKMKRLVAQLRE